MGVAPSPVSRSQSGASSPISAAVNLNTPGTWSSNNRLRYLYSAFIMFLFRVQSVAPSPVSHWCFTGNNLSCGVLCDVWLIWSLWSVIVFAIFYPCFTGNSLSCGVLCDVWLIWSMWSVIVFVMSCPCFTGNSRTSVEFSLLRFTEFSLFLSHVNESWREIYYRNAPFCPSIRMWVHPPTH